MIVNHLRWSASYMHNLLLSHASACPSPISALQKRQGINFARVFQPSFCERRISASTQLRDYQVEADLGERESESWKSRAVEQ